MITENAPVFTAAGDGLAAVFAVNFTADLQHQLYTDGLWQGDAVRGKSLYVDNYENNFPIDIYNGGQTTRCPAYSEGFVTLNGSGSVILTAGGAATVSMKVHSEEKQPGFTARGNAPVVVAVTPYTLQGSINLVAGNTVQEETFIYHSGRNSLFMATVTNLVIEISVVTKTILSVKTWAKVPRCFAEHPTNGTICVGNSDGTYGIYDPSTGVEPTWFARGAACRSVIWHPVENVWYMANNTEIFTFVTPGTVLSNMLATNGKFLTWCPTDSKIYFARPGFDFLLWYVSSSTTFASETGINGTDISQIRYVPYDGQLYILTSGNVSMYRRNVVAHSSSAYGSVLRAIGPGKFSLNTTNNKCYCAVNAAAPNNGFIDAFDVPLKGVNGSVALGVNTNITASAYAPTVNLTFSVHANEFVYYYT